MVREAVALSRQGRVPEAILAYQRVLQRWPSLTDCWYNLGLLQRRARQPMAALASYQKALELGVRKPEEVHLNRSVIFADLRQDDAAISELLVALRLNPTYTPALLNLANRYEDLGQREQALAAYERLLALEPRSPEALARYAMARKVERNDDPLIERLRCAMADPETSPADRASLGFALGNALDACGDYRAAFQIYVAANRHSRRSAPPGAGLYDRAE